MKIKSLLLITLLTVTSIVNGQKKVKYEAGLSSSLSTDEVPFWLHSNKRGLVPNKSYAMADFLLGMDFDEKSERAINFMWEASAVTYTGSESKFILDKLHLTLKWKFLQLSLGQKPDSIAFDGLSSTNGNLLYSNNARSYPKYELSVPEWTDIPFLKGIVSFKALLSDGITTDNRYIDNALIHHKNIFIRLFKDKRFSISGGIEHFAIWSGTHPIHGKISTSVDKYFKVFTGAGDKEGEFGNDAYRLGNHNGSYHLNIYYNSENYNLQAYYRSIFEDGSGRKSENFPDGLYGLYYNNKNDNRPFVQSALIEFCHTMDQSGKYHGTIDLPEHKGRGKDNYFNHREYQSGWTHYNRTIGSPLFTNGEKYMTIGKIKYRQTIINNRFKALHLGVSGYLCSVIPYKTYFTFSQNYGNYMNRIEPSVKQFSGLIEISLPSKKIPFKIDLACAMDRGDLLKNNVGFFIRLSKSGLFK